MPVKLSSKGQLVLPKYVRQELKLKPGAEFEVNIVDGKIILQPVLKQSELQEILTNLRQITHGMDLLDELEAEHQQEIEKDRQREQSLRAG